MATIKTIGTNGTRDFSLISTWHAAFATGGWIGEWYNDGVITELVGGIGGSSATDYEILRTATGQSAFDNGANPLQYDATKGAALTYSGNYSVPLQFNSYITASGFQVANTGYQYYAARLAYSNIGILVDRCLFYTAAYCPYVIHVYGNPGYLSHSPYDQVVTNCVMIANHASTNGVYIGYNSNNIVNCTIVCPSDIGSTASAFGSYSTYTGVVYNTVAMGFASFWDGNGTFTGSNNATDKSTVGFGSSNVTSLTYANQFNDVVSTGGVDFRLKAGNGLAGLGADLHTNYPTIANDIFGTARTSSYDIGAMQTPAATGVSLLGRGSAGSSGAITISLATALAAKGKTQSSGKTSTSLATALAARGWSRSAGRVTSSLAAALAARGWALSSGRSVFGQAAVLVARGWAASRGALSSPSLAAALSARGWASARGTFAAPSLATALAARGLAIARGVTTAALSTALSARGFSASSGGFVRSSVAFFVARGMSVGRGGASVTMSTLLAARGFAASLGLFKPDPIKACAAVADVAIFTATANDGAIYVATPSSERCCT